jgi:hypothetical protein
MQKKTLDGIADAGNYRKLMEPIPVADAEKHIENFFRELYDLRNKHGIADVYAVVKLFTANDDGAEGEVFSALHCGSELEREPMVAWALGYEQSQRQARIANMIHRSAFVTKQERKA